MSFRKLHFEQSLTSISITLINAHVLFGDLAMTLSSLIIMYIWFERPGIATQCITAERRGYWMRQRSRPIGIHMGFQYFIVMAEGVRKLLLQCKVKGMKLSLVWNKPHDKTPCQTL